MGLPFANVLEARFQPSCPLTAVLPVMRSWVMNQGAPAKAEVMDAGIIAAAQRVEHYEMAGYRLWLAKQPLSVNTRRIYPGTSQAASQLPRNQSQRLWRPAQRSSFAAD
jgi:hypothetical protein